MDEVLVRLGVDVGAEAVAAREFEVVVIRAGEANGYFYSAEVLAAGCDLFRGATVFVNHPDALDMSRPGGRRVEDVAGVVSDVWYEEPPPIVPPNPRGDGSSEAVLRACLATRGPRGPWVAEMAAQLVADREAGLPVPNIGLSADMYISVGKDGRTVTAIKRVVSLDVVFDPAAGGAFERVLNSVRLSQEQAHTTSSSTLLATILQVVVPLYSTYVFCVGFFLVAVRLQ